MVKIKNSSLTKLFTPHERASKIKENGTFPVPIRDISHEMQPIKSEKKLLAHAQYTNCLFEYELKASINPFQENVKCCEISHLASFHVLFISMYSLLLISDKICSSFFLPRRYHGLHAYLILRRHKSFLFRNSAWHYITF